MKKFLFAVLVAALTFGTALVPTDSVTAQSMKRTVSTDTTSGADTTIITFGTMPSKLKGMQATVRNVSATTGGYVLLQGTIDGIVWKDISTDTLTVSGLTSGSLTSRMWTFTSTYYLGYRFWFKSTGSSQKSTLAGSYLRRTDE